MGEFLDAALKYDSIGWVLHPLSPPTSNKLSPGKKPILNGWQQRKKNNTHELKQWFGTDSFNIGLVCGETSNITIIDIDNDLFSNELFGSIDIDTLKSSRTAGRGHLFFKYTNKLPAQKHHDLGFEILSNGSNAVLPPSKHVSGDMYFWKDENTPIAEMPQTIIDNINKLVEIKKRVAILISKARKCFKELWNDKPDLHGAAGRDMMLAFCTELKANGAVLDDILFVSKIMYGKDFDSSRTTTEYNNSDSSKPWKCNTIELKLPGYVHCDDCSTNKKSQVTKVIQQTKLPDVMDVAMSIQEQNAYIFDNSRCFWLWIDNHYVRVDETDIVSAVLDNTNSTAYLKRSLKGEILDAIRVVGRKSTVVQLPGHWIQFSNVVIDIKTGNEFQAEHTHFYTCPIPHKLGHSTDTPNIDQLFSDWVGEDSKQILYEICAYCMLPSYPIHRMFWFYGVGRNGKGRFMALIRKLIGMNNTTSTDLERLSDSRFESAKLYKKLVAFVGETDHNLLKRTNLLKALTGDDVIGAEFKNKEPFDFFNTAKILIATNSVPVIEDKTEGWYARNIIIDFPNQFKEGNDIINIVDEWEIENMCRKCVNILHDLLEKGEFHGEGNITDKKNRYEESSNPIKLFIDSECYTGIDFDLPMYMFRAKFVPFLEERGYRTMSDKEISMRLKTEGYEIIVKRIGKNTWRCLKGIGFKNEKQITDEQKHEKIYITDSYGIDDKSTKPKFTVTDKNSAEWTDVTEVTDVTDFPTYFPIYRKQVGSSVTNVTSVTDNSQQQLINDLIKYKNLNYKMAQQLDENFIRAFMRDFAPAYNGQADRIRSIVKHLNETGGWNV